MPERVGWTDIRTKFGGRGGIALVFLSEECVAGVYLYCLDLDTALASTPNGRIMTHAQVILCHSDYCVLTLV